MIIQELNLNIRKLLSQNLGLNLREAEIESRFILEHALKVNHHYLIRNSDQLVEANKLKQVMKCVSDRLSHKPLAYIFKEWKFYDMKFYINSNVLIPRQDTELLVDLIIKEYDKQKKIDILDLGTGSGAIGIVLGNKFKNANILLSDISFNAIDIAKKNILRHKLKNISIIQSDWFTNIPKKKFEVIVSNPPYINKSDPHLQNKGLLYEPKDALVSEKEGYADILEIIKLSPRFLKPYGTLYIEHGYNQHEKIHQLFLEHNFIKIEQNEDLNGIIRTTSGKINI
ncbi:peptide chain release factor N(5)-glutamine methyltransferase [Methylophilaceae bacterium]|mgnify:CR=1 FL=1|nr:peptide chain release factor N(5)-glutamine methyltransferase [Methylophilaceae bacterium]|tara:strand:+ start:4836 stop:5687 length:852 start_codon:yes stop_codon:yes gene_type:complete